MLNQLCKISSVGLAKWLVTFGWYHVFIHWYTPMWWLITPSLILILTRTGTRLFFHWSHSCFGSNLNFTGIRINAWFPKLGSMVLNWLFLISNLKMHLKILYKLYRHSCAKLSLYVQCVKPKKIPYIMVEVEYVL